MNINKLLHIEPYMFQTGSNHNAVKVLKTLLNSSENTSVSGLKIDTVFSKETETALISFQKNKALEPTGRMNLKTWLAVGAEMDPISIQVLTMSDPILRDLLQSGYRSKFPFKKTSSKSSAESYVHYSSSIPFSSARKYNFTFRVFVSIFAPFDWFGPFRASAGDNKNGEERKFRGRPLDSYRLQCFSTITATVGRYDYLWRYKQQKPFDLMRAITKAAPDREQNLFGLTMTPTKAEPDSEQKSFTFTNSITEVSPPTDSYLWTPLDQEPEPEKSEGHLKNNESPTNFGRPASGGITNTPNRIKYHLSGNDDAFAFIGDNSWLASDIDLHPDISFHTAPDK